MFSTRESGSYQVKFASEETANSNGSGGSDMCVSRYDAGLNLGMGYRQGPVQLQLGYGIGLGNLMPLNSNDFNSGNRAQNRVLQLSVNYFFSGK